MAEMTASQQRKIFILAKERGIDNDMLHAHVFNLTKKVSLKELTISEAVKVIDSLEVESNVSEVSISKPIVDIGSASGNLSAEYRTVSMKIGSTDVKVNGILTGSEDVAPQIINGRTMVPVRSVSEWMEAKVEWNDAQKTVYITKALNSSVSDAVFEKQMVQAAENEVLNKLFSEEVKIVYQFEIDGWISEQQLYSHYGISFDEIGFSHAPGFTKIGKYHNEDNEFIYPMEDMDYQAKYSVDGIQEYSGIQMEYKEGQYYFKLDDLKQKNIID